MTKHEIKTIEHTAYWLPFKKDLTIPYRANRTLKDKIDYIFRHPSLPQKNRTLYIDVSTSGSRQLNNDMATLAIALTKEYITNPQHYGNAMENIQFQIIMRMWRQTFRHCSMQQYKVEEYIGTKMKTLAIENGLFDELVRVVLEEDYIKHNDDMVKKRKLPFKTYDHNWKATNRDVRGRVGLGTHEGSKNFDYLCSLE